MSTYSEPKQAKCFCKKCKSPNVFYQVVEAYDGGYEDYFYYCSDCKWSWWIDGIDS